MRLDLTEIANYLGKRIYYDIDEAPLEDIETGLKCLEQIKGKASFTNSGGHIVVRGNFHTVIELECCRCLRPYVVPIDLPIEEEFALPGHSPVIIDELEVEGDLPDEAESLFVDNIFNLTEYLRQAIVVAFPIKTLCSEECKGLCQKCGKVLSEGLCDCPPDNDESPFAVLKALLDEDDQKTGDKS